MRTKQEIEQRISDLKDKMADLRLEINRWESWGFDAMEGYDLLEQLDNEVDELMDDWDELDRWERMDRTMAKVFSTKML